jgi:hypothetical protein
MKPIIVALFTAFALSSCRTPVSESPKANAPVAQVNRVEHITVWSCSMHPQVQMPDKKKCPVCMMDTVKTGLVLTYGKATRFFCPEHGGSSERQGNCSDCGKALEPFQTEALLDKQRKTVIK